MLKLFIFCFQTVKIILSCSEKVRETSKLERTIFFLPLSTVPIDSFDNVNQQKAFNFLYQPKTLRKSMELYQTGVKRYPAPWSIRQHISLRYPAP